MRLDILNGMLPFPGKVILDKYPDLEERILAMWEAVWQNYLSNNDTNGLYWYAQLGPKAYNDVIRRLCHHNWVISHSLTGRKWASIELNTDKLMEFLTPDEIESVKAKCKYKKYLLECKHSKASTLVKQNGKTKRTGLVRKGFRDAGNTQFGYDMETLNKYEKAVKLNLTKSMDKIRQAYPEMHTAESSYDVVSVGIYDWHNGNKSEVFTTGNSISDSRGRAISNALCKVFNPISSKDARSALLITYPDE